MVITQEDLLGRINACELRFGLPTKSIMTLIRTLAIAVKLRAGSACELRINAEKDEGLSPKAYEHMVVDVANVTKYEKKTQNGTPA